MKDDVFIDSNIFLYAFCNKSAVKQVSAKNLITQDALISVQVINEVSVNLLRKLQMSEKQIKDFIASCYIRYTVVNLSENIFSHASDIRSKYAISYFDSTIVASALENNCKILYSEDMQHNQIIENTLKIINPFIS